MKTQAALSAMGILCCLVAANPLRAQASEPFFTDFSAGLPANARVFGNAIVESVAGVENSSVLKLVINQRDQMGSFILDPLDGTNLLSGFGATFKVFMGGGHGACGFALCLAPALPDRAFGEEAVGTGLTVTFDTFKDLADDDSVPGVRVSVDGKVVARQPFSGLRSQRFVDVSVNLVAGGLLDVTYDGVPIFTNLVLQKPHFGGQFALSARTGDDADDHFVDDLRIATQVIPALLESFLPADDNAAPDATIEITLRNFAAELNPKSIQLTLDDSLVGAVITTNKSGFLVIQYRPETLLEPGSSHHVHLVYAGREIPPKTNFFTYGFVVNPNILISK